MRLRRWLFFLPCRVAIFKNRTCRALPFALRIYSECKKDCCYSSFCFDIAIKRRAKGRYVRPFAIATFWLAYMLARTYGAPSASAGSFFYYQHFLIFYAKIGTEQHKFAIKRSIFHGECNAV